MTAGAILTTSHVMLHVWDRGDQVELHFDLYSCSDFEPEFITQELDKAFGTVFGYGTLIDRRSAFTKMVQPSPVEFVVNGSHLAYA